MATHVLDGGEHVEGGERLLGQRHGPVQDLVQGEHVLQKHLQVRAALLDAPQLLFHLRRKLILETLERVLDPHGDAVQGVPDLVQRARNEVLLSLDHLVLLRGATCERVCEQE